MLNRAIHFLVHYRILVYITIIVILLFGLLTSPFDFGFKFLPKNAISVDAIPDIGENQQIIYTEWNGQSPQEIEDQITYPLTTNLLGITGVKSVRSNSMFGVSSVYVIFDDDVDYYWSRTRILEKLSALPKDLLPAGVQPKLGPDATSLGQLFWYTLEGRDKNGKITGGWSLQETRSIQDFFVKNALAAADGVAEVASVGGHVKEYQIDVDPEKMRQYKVSLSQVIRAVKSSNKEIGAQTIEINRAEYFVRGLGYVKSIADIENAAIYAEDYTPIRIKDVAQVSLGPAERRGILDKGGAEVTGGVVTARYGENPMNVVAGIHKKIKEIQLGMPKKILADGTETQLTIVPFYDRGELIEETLGTLKKALWLEILIGIIVILLLLRNLKTSLLVSSLMPLSVLLVFIGMKLFNVDANIVSLAGIAIAIGTIVDMGIILTENIIRNLEDSLEVAYLKTIKVAVNEVSGAILTAGLTTIVSFIPVFMLSGAEGKLFAPLAITKTFALAASLFVTLFILPPIAALVFKHFKKPFTTNIRLFVFGCLFILGIIGSWFSLICLALIPSALASILFLLKRIDSHQKQTITIYGTVLVTVSLLSLYWRPLGITSNFFFNFLVVVLLIALVLVPIYFFKRNYEKNLSWVLAHKSISLSIPVLLVFVGFLIFWNTDKEFMPKLKEGDYLLMPTSLPHAGIEETNQVLKKLDMAVASLPEIDYVVGKAGRVNSALDPAPLTMYENLISFKSEYIEDVNGTPIKFKSVDSNRFITKNGDTVIAGSGVKSSILIKDKKGAYYRNWRPHVKTEDDIWSEISKVTQLPGVTASPKLQPIETRLVMLQTGMRSSLGIKVKGQDLEKIQDFSLELEKILKEIDEINPASVFAERITGKPYLLFNISRDKIARYGLTIAEVQETLEVAVGGKIIDETIEGRERYAIRVRYPRELRNSPEELKSVYIDTQEGISIPLIEFVEIEYQRGPQSIKSEDGFLVNYLTFDKKGTVAEVKVVEKIKSRLTKRLKSGEFQIPNGITYEFAGNYENHLRAQKTMLLVIPLVLLVIVVILFLQFRSVAVTFIVFSGVAVAFSGAFILLWFYNQDWFMNINLGEINLRNLFQIKTINLSVAVWVGFIALFGIATDDGVVMATYLNQSFAKNKTSTSEHIRKAVIEAGKKRIRPCLITTATTILALFPILISRGRGAEIMLPMAIPILGGMLMALITLFVVPLIYCWWKEVTLKNSKQA
ncbi:cation transporter [Croceivirga lutea]|uniref:efflux RND transporter permease subunit n=1 Tax=Croceivirga lutea TaxID=1775167 RepID=UPI00163A141D|nr:efflux RND transporter permease subunit [Croceivirga lutea]GGG42411.1 cation transporter [Croceivirga lutea]